MTSTLVEPKINSSQQPSSTTRRDYPVIRESDVLSHRERGYLVVEGALTPGEVTELRHEAARICRGELGALPGVPPSRAEDSDDEVISRVLCLHQPHKVSPVMHRYLAHRTIVDVLTRIISPNVKAMQSMLFIKAAGKPGQAWHQDEDYIPTRDRSLTGVWIAMDDATVENGCLWVIPGSQRHGVLWPLKWHGDRRFDCAQEAYDFPFRDEDAIPVEVKAGAMVFFNGYLLHRSLPNHAKAGFRRALVNHYMSAESLLPWNQLKEGQSAAQADFRDIVMIAGKDPYAYKGLEEVCKPSVRPTGQGGCGSWGDYKYKDEEESAD